MELKDIIAIRGKSDLYRILAKTPKGIVVESLNEKRVKFKVQPDLHVLLLSDITIFSNDNTELYLQDVLLEIFEKDGLDIKLDPKDEPNKLREYFKTVAPNHDEEKVYISDMKKMVKWYKIIGEYYPDVFENLKKEKEEMAKEDKKSEKKEDEKVENKDEKKSQKKESKASDKTSRTKETVEKKKTSKEVKGKTTTKDKTDKNKS